MAKNELWMKVDVQDLVSVEQMRGTMFSADDGANLIGVEVFDSGEPKTLSGSVTASVIRQDGETVTVSGNRQGNRAWIVLTDDCYEAPGLLSVFIKLINGDDVVTIGALEGEVYRTVGWFNGSV